MPDNNENNGRIQEEGLRVFNRVNNWFLDHPPIEVHEVREPGGVVPAIRIFQRNRAGHNTPGKRGEELFHLILSGIREVYDVSAVIAGGAVRDLAVGAEDYKDVDVFIPMKIEDFLLNTSELGWSGEVWRNQIKPYKGKASGTFQSSARAGARVQGMSLDLVFMENGLTPEVVRQFPVHTQRCVWTLNNGLKVSPEAQADLDAKTFTIDPTITDKDQLKVILEKVTSWQKRDAYKGWKIIEPDIKEWWEAKDEQKKEEGKMKVYEDYTTTFKVVA